MDRRRQAILHRAVGHERRHGETHADEARSHDHGRLVAEQAAGELHRDLRLALVVMEHELQIFAADAAGLIDLLLQHRERVLLTLTDERRVAGQRQHDVDVVASGGTRGRRRRERKYRGKCHSAYDTGVRSLDLTGYVHFFLTPI